MAKNDDDNGIKYKEGVDFEIVDKGGYKTRRFFTKAEKDAMKNPKPAPKAAVKKPRPKAIPKPASSSSYDEGEPMPKVNIMGDATGYKRGGTVKRMASGGSPDDKYVEGKDFEMVDKGGYKTRRFFTKAEKDAMKNPKPAPKAAAPKKPAPKLKGIKTEPITTSPIPKDVAAAAMKALGKSSTSAYSGEGGGAPKYDIMGNATGMKRGGKVAMKEGSAKDMREDKAMAKKRGMTMKAWEKSAADKKHDAPKKMATGGVVKKATGGSMRGTGCAMRGKGFSGSY